MRGEKIFSLFLVLAFSLSFASAFGSYISDSNSYFNGTVGVGTNSVGSGFVFDVLGDARIDGNLTVTGSTTQLSVQNLDVNGSIIPQQDSMFDIGNLSSRWRGGYFSSGLDVLGDSDFDNGTLYIDSSNDRVGIGTSTPDILFVLNSSNNERAFKILNENDTKVVDVFVKSDGSGSFFVRNSTDGAGVGLRGDGDSYIVGGNFGIGTKTPETFLHIYNGDAPNGPINPFYDELYIESNETAGITIASGDEEFGAVSFASHGSNIRGGIFYNHSADDLILRSNGANNFVVNANGNVGIGTVSPARAKLVVDGFVNYDNGAYGYLNSGGSVASASAQTVQTSIYTEGRVVASEFNAVSDARVKSEINSVENALDIVDKFNVVAYNKATKGSDSKMGEVGLIGQEAWDAYPLSVRISSGDVMDENGNWVEVDDFHAVNYQTVSMIGIRAIQELKAENEELRLENKMIREDLCSLGISRWC